MAYTIEFLKTAAKELAALPRPPGATLLHAKERVYRLRVGDYRLIYGD